MILTLVLILLLIGAAVVGSIYSNFLVFYSSFNESENYHKAYYSSITALERAELVVKQRAPGYEGNGGRKIGEKGGTGYNNNGGSDGVIPNFSYLSNNGSNNNKSTVFREIKSKTTRIPAKGNGDIEAMLSYTSSTDSEDDSINYNMMDYKDTETSLLYYDSSDGNPYKKTKGCVDSNDPTNSPCIQSNPKMIRGKIRLPKFLQGNFGELDENNSLVDKSSPGNDAIVDRQIRGKYDKDKFTIYATQKKTSQNSKQIDVQKDSAIRESHVNNNDGLNFKFSKTSKRSPTPNGGEADLTIISPKENEIKKTLGWYDSNGNLVFNPHNNNNPYFEKILSNNLYTEKQLRFSLLNLLQTKTTSESNNTITPKIYPFLEYYIEFFDGENPVTVSDKYFTINAEGNYGDYKINKIIWRPTSKESVLGSFTSVF